MLHGQLLHGSLLLSAPVRPSPLAAWLVSRLSRPRGTQVFESHSLLCWQHNHYYWAEINMSHQPDDVKGTRFASWDLVLDRI